MKKLVSAAMVGALLASAVSAEVSIKMNARVRGDMFENRSGKAETENVLFSNSSNDTDSVVSAGAADTLTLEAKNDYAGVKFAFNNDLSKGSTGVDSYHGWLKFGDLKFRGAYNIGNRTANRITTDQNTVSLLEGNLTAKGVYSEGKNVGTSTESWSWKSASYGNSGKLGINKNLAGTYSKASAIGADIDNMDLNITAGKALAWGLEYGISDVLPGDLTLMGYLIESSGESVTTNDDGETTSVLNSQYAFKADYNQKDLFRLTFDGKIAHQKMAFGLFFSPLMVENLALTTGGTFALDRSDPYDVDKNITYWGVDFRARYAINEAIAATFYANVSGMSKPTDNDDDNAHTALDLIANFNYKLNDIAKLFVEAEYATLSLNSDDAKNGVSKATVVGQVGTILTAGKGATLTPALRLTAMGLGMDKDKGYSQGLLISVPVVMRIQL